MEQDLTSSLKSSENKQTKQIQKQELFLGGRLFCPFFGFVSFSVPRVFVVQCVVYVLVWVHPPVHVVVETSGQHLVPSSVTLS